MDKKQIMDTMRPGSPVNINLRYIYLSVQCLQFLGLMITIFTQDIGIFLSEHENKWYSTGSYFWSKTLLDIPNILIISYIYSLVIYLGSGQLMDMYRMAYFILFSVRFNN